MDYLNLFIQAAFVENLALAFFLGMCSFLACSKQINTSLGLGAAVIFVMTMTVPMNRIIYDFLLADGALAWISPTLAGYDLSFLYFLAFIGTIAAAVQLVEMFNKAIKQIRADGTYKKIQDKYFDFNVYGE